MAVLASARGFSERGEQTGLLVASAAVPGTFVPSLVPRSMLDQGIVTGLTATLSYVLTVGTQDAIEAAAAAWASKLPGPRAEAQRRAALLLDVSAIPVGLLVQRSLARRAGEPVLRGLLRQAAWRTTVTGAGGVLFAGVRSGAALLDARLGGRGRITRFPVAVPAGLLLAYAIEWRRRREVADETYPDDTPEIGPAGAAAAGVGVAAGLMGISYGEHLVARATGSALANSLPGPHELWRLVGHGLCLGTLVAGGTAVFHRAMQRIEAGATAIEPVLDDEAAHRWVGPTISGGRGSLVIWGSLGREGRRHAFAYVRPRPVANRPLGIPDLSIETVMGEPAKSTPVQIYVGLDSASTAQQRVELALAEMDRTAAWDRALLMLVSPTGTGYVNYCAAAAVQYLTLGDVAIVTLQYSKRPSPLSLLKVKDAREQNRLLWLSISRHLRERQGPGPRVVLFGESLGAHTSQDVLLHWGTLGPAALGIERALWIGTPYFSGWMHEVTGSPRPDVDSDSVITVNDFGQLAALPQERRSRLRYVMVSHDNDGVTKFGADLIASRPAWLESGRTPVELISRGSPRGVPTRIRWRPITTFFQTMIDMKNAQIPGAYRAWAHDYRPDLTRFISEVYDLPASPKQIDSIEHALEQRETLRELLFSAESLEAMAVAAPITGARTSGPGTSARSSRHRE